MTVFPSVRAKRRIDYIPLRYFRYGIHILDYTLQTHCFYIVRTFTAMVNGPYMPLCIRGNGVPVIEHIQEHPASPSNSTGQPVGHRLAIYVAHLLFSHFVFEQNSSLPVSFLSLSFAR